MKDQYHVIFLPVNSLLMPEKKVKTKFIDVPSMVELMNTKSDSEQYKIMLFVNIVLKYIKTLKKVNADNLLNNEIGNIKKGTGRA